MNVVELIEQAGASVTIRPQQENADDGFDLLLATTHEGHVTQFAVETKHRAPYPSEIADIAARHAKSPHQPLIVADYVTREVGKRLAENGISWVDSLGNADIRVAGLIISRRSSETAPRRRSERLPTGSGSWAMIRNLIADGEVQGVTDAARRANVSQPRASQVLHQLQDLSLVERHDRSRWEANQEGLLEAFLDEYPGPGGTTTWYYRLDPLPSVAETLRDGLQTLGSEGTSVPEIVVSGDVAADRLAPWRKPTMLTVYVSQVEPRIHTLLVESGVPSRGSEDANVEITVPNDTSVFTRPGDLRDYAHPTQIIWDLRRLGGEDRIEAADRVRQWLISH